MKGTPHTVKMTAFLSEKQIDTRLDERLGTLHARQRLGIEKDHEAQVFGQGLNFFHIENFPFSHLLISAILKMSGLYWLGERNAACVRLRTNDVVSDRLPESFDGFKILHLSDLHAGMSQPAIESVAKIVNSIDFDICVLTGDFRARTYGPFQPCLTEVAQLRSCLGEVVYGVLGNHDSIRMVPDLERMNIRMLLNECEVLRRGNDIIHLAGIDDAHFYRVDNIEKAAADAPLGGFSILLSHTPEIYRQAAHAGFDLLLSGHTHGGQICLPGGFPITLDSSLPRAFGSGAWRYREMAGYTSVGTGSCIVPVRFNCPPEITLHRLRHPHARS
jgi:predicted MPP superfamily phosphohydrolase